jgi:type VI secretion system VasD/TssJ family lipoprotein
MKRELGSLNKMSLSARAQRLTALLCAASCGAALLANGCGGSKPTPACDKSELVAQRFEPNPTLNPDREGNTCSVVVRVYQLEGIDPFMAATFADLWQGAGPNPSGGTVVSGPEELTIIPGRNETRTFKRSPKATHLALAGNFREIHPESGWKTALELPQAKDPCREGAAPIVATVSLINYSMQLR